MAVQQRQQYAEESARRSSNDAPADEQVYQVQLHNIGNKYQAHPHLGYQNPTKSSNIPWRLQHPVCHLIQHNLQQGIAGRDAQVSDMTTRSRIAPQGNGRCDIQLSMTGEAGAQQR